MQSHVPALETPVIALLLATLAHASDVSFIPEIQFRPRLEVDTGRDGDPATDAVAFVTHRARLGVTVAYGTVSGRIVLSDVRTWGEEQDTRRDFSADGFDVRVAAFTWSPPVGLELVIGRQEISLQDERFLARANWRQPGRSFDGFRMTWEDLGWSAEAIGLLVLESDDFDFAARDQVLPNPDPDAGDRSFWAVRGGMNLSYLVVEAVGIVDDRRDQDLLRGVAGVHVRGSWGIFSGLAEGYGQFGHAGDDTIRAFLVGVRGTVAPEMPGRPTFTLWYDLLSGDDDPDDGLRQAFDTLYGANHRHYGVADIAYYFVGGPSDGRGLHDVAFKLGVQPHDRVDLDLDLHLFAPHRPSGNERLLGFEPDLRLRVRAHRYVTVDLGGSAWVPLDDSDREVDGWGYLMLDLAIVGPHLTAHTRDRDDQA